MLKLASYNIHKGIGLDRRRNPDRIVSVLNEIDADIVALQEADRRFGSRKSAIPPLLLEDHSDYRAVPLDVQVDSMGWHGNAILVRKSAQLLVHDILHIPSLEPRGAVMAQVETGGLRLCVFGMHLDLSGLWRRRQAVAMLRHADHHDGGLPLVMMGDLNEWAASGGCLRDFGRRLSFAECGRSFHARRPVGKLDRIMHCDRLRVIDSGVHDTTISRRASDHLPVWATVELS
ncbi:endonuclease/exonuclease/phosphatase family protein [Parasphingopyxis marina]|uniref:Endonuclease/exonuclease/phosphatase family protein n=1 Tax=Parasphingopyxis marina TaxID=2761622 RepID=A0A842HZY6_9SPHN|nr:endonuclease/exonuclease/phosphatase family protein [Parasphingopyxis marina]MBC2778766.1 endonuclease/exonuclease/phosphatase family protein [Parasphingopyxis marina]